MTPEQAELDRIYAAIEKATGVTRIAIKSSNRGPVTVTAARRAACLCMRDRLCWSKQQIAKEVNRSAIRVGNMLYRTGYSSREYISESTIELQDDIENRIRAALSQ